MSHVYPKRALNVNGKVLGLIVQDHQGCAELVAICNLQNMRSPLNFAEVIVIEDTMVANTRYILGQATKELQGVNKDDITAANNVLADMRNNFSLIPCLAGHNEFVDNASSMLCLLLYMRVLHAWVLDPELNCYEKLKGFSRSQLEDYCKGLEEDHPDHAVCHDLLNANQLTPYGLRTLSAELQEDDIALFYWKNRLDIICKHEGAVFILIAYQAILKKMPGACLMLLEESQDTIYFTTNYKPVKGQPFEERAKEWHRTWCAGIAERQEHEALSKAAVKKGRKEKKKIKRDGARLAHEDGQAPVIERPNTSRNAARNKWKKMKKLAKKLEPDDLECAGNEDKGNSVGSSPKERTEAGTASQEGAEAFAGQDNDDVLEGDPSDFMKFLMSFKAGEGTELYFEGTVAAFASQAPFFYVPYHFILDYDEQLALNIQDNYASIYDDLRGDVVSYLLKKGVDFPDAQLYVIGRPDPKSTQCFLDFIESITLHEVYDVYGGAPEALPSSDFRRMALGYLASIVAKFRKGKCWNGEWTERDMKVKNKGRDFVIDCDKEYDLTPDRGYADLQKFSMTVLMRLKINGKLPPYCDEFGADIMVIDKCFGDAVKWERFLQLISYPLCLKLPLVRAAFLCNVYIAANANSSGRPPRYTKLFSRLDCFDWRSEAQKHGLLTKVYHYHNEHNIKKWKYYVDIWSPSHWHVFKFSRHVIQHVLRHTKENNLIQKVRDISFVDILLSQTICKAIAQSVRFLVLNVGINGIFSSAWRHYAGSDYVDKPNEIFEEATDDMLEELVDSVTDKRTGYVFTEVEVISEPQHLSLIFNEADLPEIQTQLNLYGFECTLRSDDGILQCGSILLSIHRYPAESDAPGRTVIVVEGPYSTEYDAVFMFLTRWLCI